MNNKGMLLIISGPSGSGKGTVVKQLDPANNYALSISVTTRGKRPGEVADKDYFYKTKEQFVEMRNTGQLLEHAEFVGNYYGTPRSYVEQQIELGKIVVLEIEVNGALQVKKLFENAVLIFLIPPTMAELQKRLVERNTENKETIADRLKRAKEEIKLIDQYGYLVVNHKVSEAVAQIDTIVRAEAMRPKRCQGTILKFKGDETTC